MNRLILVGNGFDLAHGLKTRYNDFIIWYFKKVCHLADNIQHSDDILTIYKTYSESDHTYGDLVGIDSLIEYFYHEGFTHLINGRPFRISNWHNNYQNPFNIVFKSKFMKRLFENCSNSTWVDIENEFYNQLLSILKMVDANEKKIKIDLLNLSMKCLIKELHEYLESLPEPNYNEEYRKIIQSTIKPEDINMFVGTQTAQTSYSYFEAIPDSIHVVNFNYTNTFEHYIRYIPTPVEVNYIHGKLGDRNNQLVFGFGDELDRNYDQLEDEKISGFLEYIKSFWYLKTSNYHNLIKFIDSDQFQVTILGHSCGLSDRTMLNMIFEHENCKSIKIHYYECPSGDNNYTLLTQEISRHFKDKGVFRKKVANLNKCSPMPQVFIE